MTDNSEPIKTSAGEVKFIYLNIPVGINEAAKLTKRSKGQISRDTKYRLSLFSNSGAGSASDQMRARQFGGGVK